MEVKFSKVFKTLQILENERNYPIPRLRLTQLLSDFIQRSLDSVEVQADRGEDVRSPTPATGASI